MTDRSVRSERRTKWDEKADAARADLVAEGIARILEDAVGAIAGLVSPSALARRSGSVSVDRAYRLLGDPEATLLRIMRNAADPDFEATAIGWPTFDEVSRAAVEEAGRESDLAATAAAVRHYLERNFRLPAYPLGRIITAITMTASPAWAGRIAVSPEHRALAEHLVTIDRSGAQALRAHMRWLLLDALGTLRRKPKPGMTLDLIVELALALGNGALDRMTVDPDALSIDTVVWALIDLTIALTEEGSIADPRMPGDRTALDEFSHTVRAADAHWANGGTIDDLAAAARVTGTSEARIAVTFPTVADLADSVLRGRVALADGDFGVPVTTLGLVRSSLRRLAETADTMPAVVQLATGVDPGVSVLAELRSTAAACAAEARTDPRIAERLIATAGFGTAHWETTELLLEVLVGTPRPERSETGDRPSGR